VAGALAERDFVDKLTRAGFHDVEIVQREPVSIDLLALYPLFADDLLDLMRRLVPPHRHQDVATTIVVRASR
jgi:arsenite methyltransferase